ncbi:MAG: UbiH/UbiF/VisC/COQ6 family ubiquinone biosynthesis hydroxylase [Pseudobdellovibrionaceae bacterium]
MQAQDKFDVVIVGGGLAGLSLTARLAKSGLKVACIDTQDPQKALEASFDGRTTAVSWASQKMLDQAGVWEHLQEFAAPIRDIQILDGDSPVLLEFFSEEVGGKTFGWILENRLIRKALYETIATYDLATLIAPEMVADFSVSKTNAKTILKNGRTLTSALIVGADGRGSIVRRFMDIPTRSWSYRQQAIVCNVIHENPHCDIAVENFRSEGPFAVLPMCDDEQGRHRSSVVWTIHAKTKDTPLQWDIPTFNAALNERFPDFYGAVELTGERFTYPLGLLHAYDYTGPRMVLVAEAAHGMHPIAGQGLNIGFRDIAVLTELLEEAHAKKQDLGHKDLLDIYQRKRRIDTMAMMAATDTLNKLFSNNLPFVGPLRRAGLRLVSRVSPAKHFFMKQAMGAAGIIPSLLQDNDQETHKSSAKKA